MFVETITQPRKTFEDWNEKLRMHSDPPSALAASIGWDVGDGMVTLVNVSDAPDAVTDFLSSRGCFPSYRLRVNPNTSPNGTVNPW
jgi:hypothetical protein